jgi:hypothetical protein
MRAPLHLCGCGALTRSRPFHPVVYKDEPSKRTKEAWAETRIKEPAVEAVLEAILEPVEATVEEAVLAAILEPVKTPVKARIEDLPRPRAEVVAESPVVETASEPAVGAHVTPVPRTPAHVSGLQLPGSPKHHYQS